MKISSQVLILFLFTISCNEHAKNELYSMKQIETDSKPYKTEEIVLLTLSRTIFIKTNVDDIIGRPEYDDLINLHSKYYSTQSLDEFLYKTLNLKINIPLEYLQNLKIKTFKVDSEINNEVNKFGINHIFEKITISRNKKKYLIKNLSSNEQDDTMEYLLYINKFIVVRDDYSGLSWIEKREELPLYIK